MSPSKLICYFSIHAALFGFWASLPPDNITLNPANMMVGQSSSDFHTGIGAATCATLDTEQFISCTRTALIHTNASLQGSDNGVIAASEVHELLTKIHYILGNAVSKWVGNMAHILVYLFRSASRHILKSGFSRFPFSKY